MLSSALLCVLLAAGAALGATDAPSGSNSTKDEKIWGGSIVADGEVPWLASIHHFQATVGQSSPFCSGVIISERHVLTLASCRENYYENYNYPMSVMVGSMISSGFGGSQHKVIRRWIPDNYDTNTQSNNIAILEVYPPIQFSKRAYPIALPMQNANLADDFRVLIAGMGQDPNEPGSYDFYYYGSPARKVPVNTVGTSWCRSLHGNAPFVTVDTICAGNPSRSCQFDQGGPLFHNGVLYGLIKSVACGPGSNNVPGLHTKVSYHVDWIREQTGLYQF